MNPATIELAIHTLIIQEETLENQLDLLTAIALSTTSDVTFQATEEIRYELSKGKEVKDGLRDLLQTKKSTLEVERPVAPNDCTETNGAGMFV